METATLAGVVVAIVGAVKDLLGPKITGNVTRVLALVVGGVLGYFHILASDVVTGALGGLVAVGVHTVVSEAKK